ncbi:MAG: cellulase family glycosylhydrolase [FCB group bacterium]|nr:cellulase family glycosylhydrolase [FCB group bacterium]MBL7028600.1 cellulase family glycosylhydrolase [Candidatus Neomarinimicrobiota bacterium]MBL7120819.1 cellulase family glycosylhydrolase [Candidatus Neomarinimicrobiota bacterium]
MKRFQMILILLLLTVYSLTAQPTVPFEKGVNLSNWFQESSIQEVQFSRYTYDDFVDIQSLGVDVIRLPINFHGMSSGDPDYIVDPILLDFLDQVIDWTEDLGLHLILDNHSFDSGGATTPAINQPLSMIWQQLAAHFLDRDSTLYFEIKNEPWGISDFIWDTIQQNIVNIIRQTDSNRTLIVGPSSWNSYNNLDDMMNYTDDNLIYTFHFYDPFIFTHQGASWTDPSLEPLVGVPFPYGASAMPPVPPELIGTWVHSNMSSYSSQGNVAHMRSLIDIAASFRASRDVPIFCGEFGVLNHNSDPAQRVEWYRATTHYLDSLDIGWTMWDYHGGFGLFERYSNGMFDHDLNIPLLEVMGFNTPPQTVFVTQADSVGFYIYDDFIGQNILPDFNTEGIVTLYTSNNPKAGSYHLSWSQATLYERIGFNFLPDRDLSRLLNEENLLTYWVRGVGQPVSFDIRFIDTKNALPEDHPWRVTKTISISDIEWDGTWQYVQIPLSEFVETGSWDGAWFDPEGLFDWSDIDVFEFVAEHSDFGTSELSLDEIRIVDQITAGLNESNNPTSFSLSQNFPNPFNPSTTIKFSLTESAFTRLSIYDLNGRVVETLVSEKKEAGVYSVNWNVSGSAVEAGVYFAKIDHGVHSEVIKMLLLK